ncbi:MAG TPA: hypothetical protein VK992_04170 [Candidatus Caenarcaniphilales bacterium]|nr:hypothetical protein [Candidatus Caenarcaniphilales bacterium]
MGLLKRLFGGGRGLGYESAPPRDHAIVAGLFLAPRDDVTTWDMASATPDEWPAVEFNGLGPVELGMLESIISGVSYEQIDQDDLLAPLRDGGEEGPWIIPVRPALVDALTQLSPQQIESVAKAWAKTEEMSWPWGQSRQATADLAQQLERVADLAHQSRETGRPMFLLMSL